jgi:hypothetical protein
MHSSDCDGGTRLWVRCCLATETAICYELEVPRAEAVVCETEDEWKTRLTTVAERSTQAEVLALLRNPALIMRVMVTFWSHEDHVRKYSLFSTVDQARDDKTQVCARFYRTV